MRDDLPGEAVNQCAAQKVLGTDIAVTNKRGQAALGRITRYRGVVDNSVVSEIVNSIAVKQSS